MTCHHLSLARVKQKTRFPLSYCLRFLFASPARVTSGDKCHRHPLRRHGVVAPICVIAKLERSN